ncbi:MAG: hypothetical protein CVV03_06030 [Firmicutes bacterium HGW-Firmicutes-8]|nr:MAG: hypothetical protein CVV03_06030 [Firmicutes bacterium HGW-Firmicutes-8]
MEKKKTFATALVAVLIGGILISGGLVFADETSPVTKDFTGKIPFFGKVMKHRGGMMQGKGMVGRAILSQATLDQLVKDKVITQNKADEIKAYIDKTEKDMQARLEEMKKQTPEERKALMEKQRTENQGISPKVRQDLFTELVNNSILTQEQADTIKAKLGEIAQKEKQQQLTDRLKALVEKGTITQGQSDEILKQCEDTQEERQALFEKMQALNPINQLVTNGTITQDQANAVRGVLPFNKGLRGGRR